MWRDIPVSVASPFDPLPDSALSRIAAVPARVGQVEVVEWEHYRLLRCGGSSVQSIMDIRQPARVISPVAALLLCALPMTPHAQHALNLGVGGGTLERFLGAYYPELALTSVEESPEVCSLAGEFFNVDEASVAVTSAQSFLARSSATYDVIFCDLFEGERAAPCVASSQFLEDLKVSTSDLGTVAFNLLALDQAELLSTLHVIREYFGWMLLAEIPSHGNIVVFARCSPPARDSDALEASLRAFLAASDVEPLPFLLRLHAVPGR